MKNMFQNTNFNTGIGLHGSPVASQSLHLLYQWASPASHSISLKIFKQVLSHRSSKN